MSAQLSKTGEKKECMNFSVVCKYKKSILQLETKCFKTVKDKHCSQKPEVASLDIYFYCNI